MAAILVTGAAGQLGQPGGQPRRGVRVAVGEGPQIGGDGRHAEHARAALAGALAGRVVEPGQHVLDRAAARVVHPQHRGAGGQPEPTQVCRAPGRLVRLRPGQPAAAEPIDLQGDRPPRSGADAPGEVEQSAQRDPGLGLDHARLGNRTDDGDQSGARLVGGTEGTEPAGAAPQVQLADPQHRLGVEHDGGWDAAVLRVVGAGHQQTGLRDRPGRATGGQAGQRALLGADIPARDLEHVEPGRPQLG